MPLKIPYIVAVPCGKAKVKVQYKDIIVEDVIPNFQLGTEESLDEVVSQLSSSFIKKHFPGEIDNIQFQRHVAEEIYTAIGKNPGVASTSFMLSQTRDDKSDTSNVEKATVEAPTFSGTSNIDQSKSEPLFVKIISPTGRLVRIKLPEEGLSYGKLQELIKNEFCIPIPNQRIKIGFPPKELEAPLGNESRLLPLNLCDRLIVEDCRRQGTNIFASTPDIKNNVSNDVYPNGLADRSNDLLLNVAKLTPYLFRKGGCYYEELNKAHILCDLLHMYLDAFPTKSFVYNAYSDSIELCMKSLGHFEISNDLDIKIEQVQAGESVQGHRECPVMSLKALITQRKNK